MQSVYSLLLLFHFDNKQIKIFVGGFSSHSDDQFVPAERQRIYINKNVLHFKYCH